MHGTFEPATQAGRPAAGLVAGDRHYRAFIGPPEKYDLVAAMQFNVLTLQGLREDHFLLDVGCGSLRAGRLFAMYLRAGRYFGIEPEQWLVREGIENELGRELAEKKQLTVDHNGDFELGVFDRQFDYLLAQSVFSHASPAQIRKCLAEAKKVMKPTSFFAATYRGGDSNYDGDDWVYPGCVTYTEERMGELACEAGLACTHIGWPHPNGQTWVVFTDPANAENVRILDDVTRVAALEYDLALSRERLAWLENHPCVRWGIRLKRLFER